jgi:hypothetical protein
MYALVVLFVTISYLTLISFYQRPSWWWAAAYGLSLALAMWSDYSAIFALAPQGLFLAAQYARGRKAILPLYAAGLVAAIAYLPWMPQVLDSIRAADLVERQENYLAVDQSSLSSVLLSVVGFSGDRSYFQTLRETLWNRWPIVRPVVLIALLPLIILGVRGLWRRWQAMLVVGGMLGTMVIGIWVSLLSPGFAERTVLSTVLGWAALVGAAFSTRATKLVRALSVGCLALILIVQASTIDLIFDGAVKEDWRSASADVNTVSAFNIPLITYSYAGAAETIVDLYHPGVLEGMRVITVRDGQLDDGLTNGVIPEPGLSRSNDLPAGRLTDALPATPENDLVWYLYSPRAGEGDVRAAIRRAGYTRISHTEYLTPRSEVSLDLYARPDARIGVQAALDNTFEPVAGGWTLPEDGATLTPSAGDAPAELLITNQSAKGREAYALIDLTGDPALASLSVELKTGIAPTGIRVTLTCLSAAGIRLSSQDAEIQPQSGVTDVWRSVRVATLCPEGSAAVRLSLMNRGVGDASFRSPVLSFLNVPES